MTDKIVYDDRNNFRYCFRMTQLKDDVLLEKWFGIPYVKADKNFGQSIVDFSFGMRIVDRKEEAFVMENVSQAFFTYLILQPAMELKGYKLILEVYNL